MRFAPGFRDDGIGNFKLTHDPGPVCLASSPASLYTVGYNDVSAKNLDVAMNPYLILSFIGFDSSRKSEVPSCPSPLWAGASSYERREAAAGSGGGHESIVSKSYRNKLRRRSDPHPALPTRGRVKERSTLPKSGMTTPTAFPRACVAPRRSAMRWTDSRPRSTSSRGRASGRGPR